MSSEETPSTQIGQYAIEGRAGEGGMGSVAIGRHVHLGMRAAIKTILRRDLQSDDAALRLLDEGRALAKLQHPNIVRVLDFFENGGNYYLVMEFVEGHSLKDRLDQGAIEMGEALRIARLVGTGLVAAHSRNILHRDIKPSNVLLGHHDEVKLTDFGLAKFVGAASKTRAGFVVGTPRYMAPEVVRGEEADERSDQYAFGVLLYRLVTGEEPFSGASAVEIMQAQVSKLPRSPRELNPHIPLPLQDLILKALEKDPALRHPSMTHLMVGLNHLVKGVITANFDTPRQGGPPRESPTVAIARDLEKALEPTIPPGTMEFKIGQGLPPEPGVEVINPAREVRAGGSSSGNRPISVYQANSVSGELPAEPVKRAAWVWGGVGVAVMIVLVWLGLRPDPQPAPIDEPAPETPASAPANTADAVLTIPRFNLVEAPTSLWLDPVPPAELRPPGMGAEAQFVWAQLATMPTVDLRGQLAGTGPHRPLFETVLALREGRVGGCAEPAEQSRAAGGETAEYLVAVCRLARFDLAGLDHRLFPADSLNRDAWTLLVGPGRLAAARAEALAKRGEDPAALYLAARYFLTVDPARARPLLVRAQRYARRSVEKSEIEKYLGPAPG